MPNHLTNITLRLSICTCTIWAFAIFDYFYHFLLHFLNFFWGSMKSFFIKVDFITIIDEYPDDLLCVYSIWFLFHFYGFVWLAYYRFGFDLWIFAYLNRVQARAKSDSTAFYYFMTLNSLASANCFMGFKRIRKRNDAKTNASPIGVAMAATFI